MMPSTCETERTNDDELTPEIQEKIDAGLTSLGVNAEVTHRWAGTMGFTGSGLPLAGPIEEMPNVFICAGFTGHGMRFAFMTAKRVADSI